MENKNGLQIQHQSLMTEYNMLKSELDELNTLYTEIKQEKDANKNTGSRLNYVFIAAQNSSLISIKTQRSNIISKMNDIRRNIEELKMKEFNTNKNVDQEQGTSVEVIRSLLQMAVSKEIKQEDFIEKEDDNNEYTDTDSISDFLDAQFERDEEGLVVEVSNEPKVDTDELKRQLYEYLQEKEYEMYYFIDKDIIVFINEHDEENVLDQFEFAKQVPDNISKIIKDLKIETADERLGTAETNIGLQIQIVSEDTDLEDIA